MNLCDIGTVTSQNPQIVSGLACSRHLPSIVFGCVWYGGGGAASPLPAGWTFNTAPILLKHLPPSFCQSTGLRFRKLSIADSPLHLYEPT